MRAVVQRVSWASVSVGGEILSEIREGLLVLLAVGADDEESDLDWMVDKIVHLRCFEDQAGKMNISLLDSGREMLCISQFTLYGDCRRGRRPSFDGAAGPAPAFGFYEKFVDRIGKKGIKIKVGQFGAKMRVASENDGPVNLILDSRT